jgi:hypothetical protein
VTGELYSSSEVVARFTQAINRPLMAVLAHDECARGEPDFPASNDRLHLSDPKFR